MGKPTYPDKFHDFDDWTRQTGGISILTRSTPLNEAEWVEIIEARVEKLKRHFNSMTLKSLLETPCLHSEGRLHDLRGIVPTDETSDERFSLDMQGIFEIAYRSRVEYKGTGYFGGHTGGVSCRDGHVYVWGITRKDALWVLAKIEWKGEAGYKNRGYERAEKITIQEITLQELVTVAKVTYEEIWKQLGEVVTNWMIQRHRLYEVAREFAQAVSAEEFAYKELQENILPKEILWYCDNCKTRGVYKRIRGEPVPENGHPHINVGRAHRDSSPECTNALIRVFPNINVLTPEEQTRVMKFRE